MAYNHSHARTVLDLLFNLLLIRLCWLFTLGRIKFLHLQTSLITAGCNYIFRLLTMITICLFIIPLLYRSLNKSCVCCGEAFPLLICDENRGCLREEMQRVLSERLDVTETWVKPAWPKLAPCGWHFRGAEQRALWTAPKRTRLLSLFLNCMPRKRWRFTFVLWIITVCE